jgi:hypothetical protein
MLENRLFHIFIGIALAVIISLTVREAAATAVVISQVDTANKSKTECARLPSRYSIHTEYVEEMGSWLPYTEDGPTGFDGGLIHLLSNSRACTAGKE